MKSPKTGSDRENLKGFARMEKFHPYKTFLFLSLVGSAVLFLALILVYTVKISVNDPLNSFNLPKPFILSTVVMLFSSYSLTKTGVCFKQDKIQELSLALTTTLLLSFFFIALQSLGWKQLYDAGFFINEQTGVTFLYVLSGLHLLHVIVGIVYLLSCILPVYRASGDMVKALVFFSNSYQEAKIEMLSIYWHYMDFLWLSLFLMFLFTL